MGNITNSLYDWLGWEEAGNRLLVVLIVVTAVVGIVGNFLVYHLNRRKKPKLKLDGLYKFQIGDEFTYAIRVTKKSGEGIIKGVEGFIQVGIDSSTKSFWGRNISSHKFTTDIMKSDYLVLFYVSKDKIMLPEYHSEKWSYSDPNPLQSYLDKKIQIEIDSINARVPNKKFETETIKEIIEKAELVDVTT